MRHGKGKCVFSAGLLYEGEWNNDKPDGFGRFITIEGDMYIGAMVDGFAQGQGKFIHFNNSCCEYGFFNKNRLNGKGKKVWKDGSWYEG